jgi:hypothetical protein
VRVALIQETWTGDQADALMSEFEAEAGKEYTIAFSILSMGRKNGTKLIKMQNIH